MGFDSEMGTAIALPTLLLLKVGYLYFYWSFWAYLLLLVAVALWRLELVYVLLIYWVTVKAGAEMGLLSLQAVDGFIKLVRSSLRAILRSETLNSLLLFLGVAPLILMFLL